MSGAVFLGRERELAELRAALEDASAARGRVFLLVGEPGIGKTRLASEACDLAARAGFTVHWGRCWESGGAPAYWPWSEVVSALRHEAVDGSAPRPTDDGVGALGAIAPEFAAPGAAAAGDTEHARFRIFRAVVSLLAKVSARQPVILVLDDLHASDASSLLLLQFVARELRTLRVLVIGSYRDVDARMSADTEGLLGRIGRDARTLHLGRLASDEVAAFIRSVAGEIAPATVASIFNATAGNPLFLDEVLRTMLAKGDLARVTAPSDLALPFGVRDAIRQHLARLSDEDRPVVEVASVLGSEVRPALLAAATTLPVAEVEAVLARAVGLGILVERGHHRYAFGHGLICEALYRDVPNSRRMELHARVGEALDRDLGDPERPWAELAHHLLEAGPSFVDRAVNCAIKAAERAREAAAYEEALAMIERANAALDLAPRSDAARAELCLAESLVRARTGDTARGRALCLQAATLARGLGDSELGARVALGYGAEFAFGLVDQQLVALLREALAALPPSDNPLRARVMARLAAALQPADLPQEQVEAAREAIAMARRIGDRPTLLAVIHAGMAAMMDYANPDERLPLNTEAERLAAALGDRPKALRAHARLALDHLERGDLASADDHIEGHDRLARELRLGRPMWQAPLFRSMRAMMEGRFDDAQGLIDEALAVGRQVGDRVVEWSLILHRFGLLRAREDHEALDRLRPELIGFWNEIPFVEGWWHSTEGAIHARLGRGREAAESLRGAIGAKLLEKADGQGLAMLSEICVAAGDRAMAAKLYDALAPRAPHLASWGMTGIFSEGPFDRHLALLAVLLGRRDEAVRHFEAAAARNRQLGLRPHLARVLYEHAAALAGDARVAATARALAGEARELAAELELAGLVLQIDALPISASPPATGARNAPAGAPRVELRREGDFWTVVCDEGELHLKDTRGMQTLHRLLTNPDREFHVVDLAGAGEGTADGGDAGELLDREARDAYRQRLADLTEERQEAEARGDALRAARAQEEIDFLAAELARAVGLGGRDRKAGSAAERARVAVQKRLKDAIRKIHDGAPALARHLAMTVQTGTFCAYRPAGRFR